MNRFIFVLTTLLAAPSAFACKMCQEKDKDAAEAPPPPAPKDGRKFCTRTVLATSPNAVARPCLTTEEFAQESLRKDRRG